MKLDSLKPALGAVKKQKRIGRGQGSGRGGTSTRGHKGAQSRSGYSRKFGFEGGQMPLYRRIPKFGFKNNNRIENKVINLDDIQKLIDSKSLKEVNPSVLIENGVASKKDVIKVLGRGILKTALKVVAHKFSASAEKSITDCGGVIEVIK